MISRLEIGWNLNPTLETLFRYAEALGVGLKLVLDESAQRDGGLTRNVVGIDRADELPTDPFAR